MRNNRECFSRLVYGGKRNQSDRATWRSEKKRDLDIYPQNISRAIDGQNLTTVRNMEVTDAISSHGAFTMGLRDKGRKGIKGSACKSERLADALKKGVSAHRKLAWQLKEKASYKRHRKSDSYATRKNGVLNLSVVLAYRKAFPTQRIYSMA